MRLLSIVDICMHKVLDYGSADSSYHTRYANHLYVISTRRSSLFLVQKVQL